jgi:hypothetical protein
MIGVDSWVAGVFGAEVVREGRCWIRYLVVVEGFWEGWRRSYGSFWTWIMFLFVCVDYGRSSFFDCYENYGNFNNNMINSFYSNYFYNKCYYFSYEYERLKINLIIF